MGSANAQKIARIAVRVIPRARRNEIVGFLEDGTLKLRLTAPPVDGKANQALIKFLAGVFGVIKSEIEISSGATSRTKLLLVRGANKEDLLKKIRQHLNR